MPCATASGTSYQPSIVNMRNVVYIALRGVSKYCGSAMNCMDAILVLISLPSALNFFIDLNFLDFSTPLMKKLNLQKKGTAKVLGKDCTIYAGSNVEYYVWKGLVIKKVQKEKNGTITVHEVTSIEQPASIDPTMFKMPSGYTVK